MSGRNNGPSELWAVGIMTRNPYSEAVCTIFTLVFCMTRPGREPTTNRMRSGHAYPNKSTRHGNRSNGIYSNLDVYGQYGIFNLCQFLQTTLKHGAGLI